MSEPDTFVLPLSVRKANYDSEGRLTSSHETFNAAEILAEVQRTWPSDYRKAFTEARRKLDESRAREATLLALVKKFESIADTQEKNIDELMKIVKGRQ